MAPKQLTVCVVVAASIVFGRLQSSAAGAEDPNYKPYVFKSADGLTIPYRMMKPTDYDPHKRYPLVMFFHGAGEHGTDNEAQLRNGLSVFTYDFNRKKYPCFVVAPQCPADQQWVNVPWSDDSEVQPAEPSQSMRLSMELMESLQKQFSIDEKRLYITGLSMGGFATWDAITRWPDRFAAAVPVCGGGDDKQAAKIAHLPLWAFHGGADPVVKTHRSRDMIEAMKKAGGDPKYTEYPGEGHGSWGKAYIEPELIPWMFAQSPK